MIKEPENITQLHFQINQSKLKHLKFEKQDNEYVVILVDQQEYEILKGYGKTKTDAINDLHGNLI